MTQDAESFAEQHAPLLSANALKLIQGVLDKHNAGVLQAVCELQNELEKVQQERDHYRLLYETLQEKTHGSRDA